MGLNISTQLRIQHPQFLYDLLFFNGRYPNSPHANKTREYKASTCLTQIISH